MPFSPSKDTDLIEVSDFFSISNFSWWITLTQNFMHFSGNCEPKLVGGWTNPSEKYARQIGSFHQAGVKVKNVWNHHPVQCVDPVPQIGNSMTPCINLRLQVENSPWKPGSLRGHGNESLCQMMPLFRPKWCGKKHMFLVGSWTNPFEQYESKMGTFPQFSGWKLRKSLPPPPGFPKTCLSFKSIPPVKAKNLHLQRVFFVFREGIKEPSLTWVFP